MAITNQGDFGGLADLIPRGRPHGKFGQIELSPEILPNSSTHGVKGGMRLIVPWLIGLLPILIVCFVVYLEYKARARRERYPFTRYLLRPPGESLRVRIELLDETITMQLIGAFAFGVTAAVFVQILWSHFLVALALSFPFLVGSFVLIWRARKNTNLRRDCYLGFLGERAIGEELNQLTAAGWCVFHDVEFKNNPGSKPFNLDHVVVGPGGIFAIETKTRRKIVGGKANVVTFDGNRLQYPWGSEDFGLRDARDRSAHLQKWLSDSLAVPLSVRAILALPGWSVTRKARSDIAVVSGGELANFFMADQKKECLDSRTLSAVRALLDQKCRDIGD